MKRTFYLLAAALFYLGFALTPKSCFADTIGLHIGSQHFPSRAYNNFNPGAYYRRDSGWTVGGYYNSNRKPSAYAGYQWDYRLTPSLSLNLVAGGVTGYRYPILPYLAPSITYGQETGPRFRLAYLPRFEKGGASVLHLAVEWSID